MPHPPHPYTHAHTYNTRTHTQTASQLKKKSTPPFLSPFSQLPGRRGEPLDGRLIPHRPALARPLDDQDRAQQGGRQGPARQAARVAPIVHVGYHEPHDRVDGQGLAQGFQHGVRGGAEIGAVAVEEDGQGAADAKDGACVCVCEREMGKGGRPSVRGV